MATEKGIGRQVNLMKCKDVVVQVQGRNRVQMGGEFFGCGQLSRDILISGFKI